MTGIPLTVIGGYLGAGKTTLINQILRDPQGKRYLVMVNDFGAINVDAALLVSADEDTIQLSNGCVCCTMGADLFLAIGDVLDGDMRPDHIVIEAAHRRSCKDRKCRCVGTRFGVSGNYNGCGWCEYFGSAC